jgi:hypothetical protein
MRATGVRVRWLGAVLLGLLGCQTSGVDIKPPPQEEQLREPPRDDRRYTDPIAYPKETLNNDYLKRDPAQPGSMGKPAPQFNTSGSGAGRY